MFQKSWERVTADILQTHFRSSICLSTYRSEQNNAASIAIDLDRRQLHIGLHKAQSKSLLVPHRRALLDEGQAKPRTASI
jgi:hypothetical protein